MSGPGRHPIRFGVVSDVHYTADPAPGLAYHNEFDVPGVLARLRAAIAWFGSEQVDALVLAGDLSHRGDAEALDTVLAVVASDWPGAVFAVAGNHDVLVGEEALSEAIGRLGADRILVPPCAGIRFGSTRIAAVDASSKRGPDCSASWGEDPLVIFSHWPLLSRAREFERRGLRYAGEHPEHPLLASRLLERRAPTLVVSGHLHASDTLRHGAVQQFSVGPLVEAPYEAVIVELVVDDRRIVATRRERELAPRETGQI